MSKQDDAKQADKQEALRMQHGVKPARNVGTSDPGEGKSETPTKDLPEVDLNE